MIEEVCSLDKDRRIWELKLPPDLEFIRMFPDVVNRQKKAWCDREKM